MITTDTNETRVEPSGEAREVLEVDDELFRDFEDLVKSRSDYLVLNIIQDLLPGDIAHILNRLGMEDASYVFGMLPNEVASTVLLDLDEPTREHLLTNLPQERITEIVGEMDSDDAADVVGELSDEKAEGVLETMNAEDSSQVEELLRYDENTAGGLMAKEMAVVNKNDTVKAAIRVVRRFAKVQKHIYNVYVVDENGVFIGAVNLTDLLLYAPNKRMHKIMNPDYKSVTPDVDQEEVARIFSKYDIVSLPVTDTAGKLLGRITVDDVVDVMEEEHDEDMARMVGSDTVTGGQRSPVQMAFLRLPWVMITLMLQLIAGVVVHLFDKTLSQIILLASFMPIISAISGNTGLQSAAMIVRGIATGQVDTKRWWVPLRRQMIVTLIIGSACGLVLGAIAGLWHGTFLFGLVVGTSMFISINFSGLIGTATPMISSSLGFDPAITAGPFETAFQDIIGITVFLSLATAMLQWL
ncbi:MAG: magnesium transporter [Bacteroidota bacterium]